MQIRPRSSSRIDALVTTAQRNTAHGLPWRGNARLLVKNSGIPIPDDTSHGEVTAKLLVAAWAAEAPRTARTVRALDDGTQQHVLAALQLEPSWSTSLQDAYIDSVLRLCRDSLRAVVPGLSHGFLSAARRGTLALLSHVKSQTSQQPGARAQLAAALSGDEFRCLEAYSPALGAQSATYRLPATHGRCRPRSRARVGSSLPPTDSGSATIVVSAVRRHALMSPKESSDLKARQKNVASGVGDKRERSHPANNTDDADLQTLAQYPWNQRWKSRPSLSLSMMGRALRVGLTFCNKQCTGQITTLTSASRRIKIRFTPSLARRL